MLSNQKANNATESLTASSAFAFVFTLGIVNLFADMTYEGGGSIHGPFLGALGASAAAIGFVAGAGEFLGYAVRLPAGYVSDKTGRVWSLAFIGYAINLFAIPALALAGSWPAAAVLMIAERVGRGLRKPTVESMLSHTTGHLGKAWVYALNNALDEIGAMLGPLVVALVLFVRGKDSYRTAYATLLVSTLLALVALTIARRAFPHPSQLEFGRSRAATTQGFTKSYWLHMVAAAFFAAGLTSFELISYHLSSKGIVSTYAIPVLMTLASGFGILASLVFGKMFDRIGLRVVLIAVSCSALFAPLVFLGRLPLVIVGMLLWGVGFATQDTLLKAVVAGLMPTGRRSLAFGLFYTGYGVGWLIGSTTTGLLYNYSIPAVIAFSVATQLLALPLFILAERSGRPSR